MQMYKNSRFCLLCVVCLFQQKPQMWLCATHGSFSLTKAPAAVSVSVVALASHSASCLPVQGPRQLLNTTGSALCWGGFSSFFVFCFSFISYFPLMSHLNGPKASET